MCENLDLSFDVRYTQEVIYISQSGPSPQVYCKDTQRDDIGLWQSKDKMRGDGLEGETGEEIRNLLHH